jgi:hypothetical protein
MREGAECRKVLPLLPALPDGDLKPSDAARVQAHLAVCSACREEAQAFLSLGERLRQTPVPEADLPTGAQAVAWILEADARRQTADGRRQTADGTPGEVRVKGLPMPLSDSAPTVYRLPSSVYRLLAAVVLAAGLLAWHSWHRSSASWEVVRLAGAPRIGAERIGATGRLRVGEWLVTDGHSEARIERADIGQVKIEPNTRLRIVESRPNEHRLALARGTLHARVLAPPRLFLVETPSAVAVDLGCAYSLAVDGAGRGLLRVTWGRVAFVLHGRESVVPAGARCETRPGIGPGTPYFEDAPAVLRKALEQLDFENGGARALGVVLAGARRRDSLTLWHLLLKASSAEQDRVYERLAALVPPPPGVTRQGVLRRDPRMLDVWQAEVEMVWWE